MTTWVSKNRGSVSCPGIKQTRIVDFRLSEGLSSQKPLILNPSPGRQARVHQGYYKGDYKCYCKGCFKCDYALGLRSLAGLPTSSSYFVEGQISWVQSGNLHSTRGG